MTDWVLSSSILIVVIAVLRYALKGKIGPRLQYALWALVLLRLLVPVNFGKSPISFESTVEAIPVVQDVQLLRGMGAIQHTSGGTVIGFGGLLTDDPHILAENVSEREFQRMERIFTAREVLMPLWHWGMVVTALVFLWANRRFEERANRGAKELETDWGVRAYVTEGVEAPCLFGIVLPAIYVTAEVAADERALRHCLAHEETHRRHGDSIWSVLRCVCLVLHWYNPLVWLAAWLSRRHSELACDEGTILRLGEAERFAYGRTLIALTCEGRGSLLTAATTMTGSKRTLTERVERIAKGTKTAYFAMRLAVLIMVLTAGCAFTGAVEPGSDGTVGLGEVKSTAEESYYTVEAELPLYTGEDADPGLWKKLEDNWRAWDSMSEMSQLLSSTLPGPAPGSATPGRNAKNIWAWTCTTPWRRTGPSPMNPPSPWTPRR
ncbi:MAG: M56 family metallopeptidase [Oscillibacter sp.]|nr:M56 family metallopeptidase [Oscillibacter sp.]